MEDKYKIPEAYLGYRGKTIFSKLTEFPGALWFRFACNYENLKEFIKEKYAR